MVMSLGNIRKYGNDNECEKSIVKFCKHQDASKVSCVHFLSPIGKFFFTYAFSRHLGDVARCYYVRIVLSLHYISLLYNIFFSVSSYSFGSSSVSSSFEQV